MLVRVTQRAPPTQTRLPALNANKANATWTSSLINAAAISGTAEKRPVRTWLQHLWRQGRRRSALRFQAGYQRHLQRAGYSGRPHREARIQARSDCLVKRSSTEPRAKRCNGRGRTQSRCTPVRIDTTQSRLTFPGPLVLITASCARLVSSPFRYTGSVRSQDVSPRLALVVPGSRGKKER